MLLAFVLWAVPHLMGSDWITTITSVAIYSVVSLGLGILYGRVGMISLGQTALLIVGVLDRDAALVCDEPAVPDPPARCPARSPA